MSAFQLLIDSGKLMLEYRQEGGVLVVRLSGSLDEDSNLGPLLSLSQELGSAVQVIQFDLGHVSGLNSCGVREWLLLMEQLAPRRSCAFVNVNELFVEQANMISNLFGSARHPVLSFQAPYHCDQCNLEEIRVLDPTQLPMRGDSPVAPEFVCPRCAAPLKFDSLEAEYFEFVRRVRSSDVGE